MTEKTALHEALRDASDPLKVLDRIVRQCLVLVPHADGASLEVRVDAVTLEYVSGAGTLGPYVGLRLPVHESLSGRSILTGQVLQCDDARTDPRVNQVASERVGAISMLCVPLSPDDGGVAVLKITARHPNAFDDEDRARLQVVARFLAVAVNAASDLARAVADLLGGLTTPTAGSADDEEELQTARFVANVMTPGLVDEVQATHIIHEVLDEQRLDIVLQPIVDMRTNEVVSCESLSRFPGLGDTGPEWWFSLAHRVGLGTELELLAVRRALEAMAVLPEPLRMTVNVGPVTAMSQEFLDLLTTTPLSPRLTIELTEHTLATDLPGIADALAPFRAQGGRLSIDDTGSGYSSLTRILQLHPDVVKLDRALVTGIDTDAVKQALATALVLFAGSINLLVVAEGVETEAERDCLIDLGIRLGQGYLMSRPLSPADMAAFATRV